MKDKRTLVCVILIMAGLLMSLVVLVAIGFELEKLLNVTEGNAEIEESFNSIIMDLDETDVVIKPSTDGKCSIFTKCKESVTIKYTVKNGELKIEEKTDSFSDFFSMGSSSMILYLPKSSYNALKIDGTTTDIELSKITFESGEIDVSTGNVRIDTDIAKLNIKVSTGDIYINGLTGDSFKAKASTGDIFLKNSTLGRDVAFEVSTSDIVMENTEIGGALKIKGSTADLNMKNVNVFSVDAEVSTGDIEFRNVISTKEMKLKTSTGDVELEGCDADTLEIKTNSGDVEGILLSSKIFYTDSRSGKISVPRSDKGGICQVTTGSGDIELKIQQ